MELEKEVQHQSGELPAFAKELLSASFREKAEARAAAYLSICGRP